MFEHNSQNDKYIWWKHGVFYHIYPKSFYDSNHDGIGDLNGIREKLPYLKDLGINAIWLSPIYLSPMFDQGYDIENYTAIDPVFGTLDDFIKLLAKAHSLGIRLILDLVMNHSSHKHKWFQEAKKSKTNKYRDYYIWRDGRKGGLPNNWKTAFGGSAWEYDVASKQFYLHSFLKEQPDLNWRNKELQNDYFKEIKFWLELGVDGFRLDVINMIGKDKKFRDNPRWLAFFQKSNFNINRGRSYKIVRRLRELVDSYPDRMLVGEIYTLPPGNSASSASYLGNGDDMLNLTFDFSLIFKRFNALSYYKTIRHWMKQIPKNAWPSFVLSNHDLLRHITRLGTGENQLKRGKVTAALLLTLKGTPFIYYGEEIAMQNAKVGRKDLLDPLGKKFWPIYTGRDKGRTPMQWDTSIFAGFSNHQPWLPFAEVGGERNLEKQKGKQGSLFECYHSLLKLRRAHKSLHMGKIGFIEKGKDSILAYKRSFYEEEILVYLNFSAKEKALGSLQNYRLLYSSTNTQTIENQTIKLTAYEVLLLIRKGKSDLKLK